MGLYLQVGLYSSAVNTVRVSARKIRPIEINKFIVAHEHELTIEGYLYAIGAGNLTTAMNSLEAAVKTPNQTIALISTEDGATAHALATSGALGGVVVKDFAFADTPLHMATQVKFTLTASAIYSNTALARNVVSLDETVTIQGDGDAETALAPQAGATSIYQTLSDYTDVMVTQSGTVISRSTSGVSLPSPLITTPGAKIAKQTRVARSYRMVGTSILLYVQEYSYSFQLATYPGSVILPTVLT